MSQANGKNVAGSLGPDFARQLAPVMAENLKLLKPIEKSWQPTEYLPDPSSEQWIDEIKSLRATAQNLSDEVLVVLVGNMITEEALPSYQTWINHLEGMGDMSGTDDSPWAQWSRGWTAEENRHGDLLNRYLYLTGRVNLHSIEVTIQHLVRKGFNPKTEGDPYKGLIYTSFQEKATRVAHGSVGRLAEKQGDGILSRICAAIASDEARHETVYKNLVRGVIKIDPEGGILAFQKMMKSQVVMPARLMDDGKTKNLYDHFSAVAQRIGAYTTRDYSEILDHLIKYWNIPELTGLSAKGAEAQAYLCGLPGRYLKLADRFERKAALQKKTSYPWIYDRSA